MEIKESPDIEFLDVYPAKKIKLPLTALILVVNIGILLTAIIFSYNLLSSSNQNIDMMAYEEQKTPYLYEIINNTEEQDKLLLFKGNVDNNYVTFNNLTWRILKVNSTGTITLILDDSLNSLPWQIGNYNIMDYLNIDFLNQLDQSKLVKTSVCTDCLNDLITVSCNEISDSYVTLLDVNSFISSIDNNETFIVDNNTEKLWLMNSFAEDNYWHTVGNKISFSTIDSIYKIKPVITLKNEIIFESGDGTKENPYLISNDKITIGSKIKLGDDLYDVYEVNDQTTKLMLSNNLNTTYAFNGDYSSLFTFLNDNFYNQLTYKDLLVQDEWQKVNIIDNEITYETYKAKVGLPNIFDFKINNDNKNYYTLTNLNNYIMIYSDPIIYGTKNNYHAIKPTVAISNDIIKNFVKQDGVYVLGDTNEK